MSYDDDPCAYWKSRYSRQGAFYVAKSGRPASYRQQLASLSEIIRAHLPEGESVLDFGCGPGRFRPALEEKCPVYVGVDLIPGLGTEPLPEDPQDWAGRDLDVAWSAYVLQHITGEEDYRSAVASIWCALRPGGSALIVDLLPLRNPADHVRPRGWGGFQAGAAWSRMDLLDTDWDGHWIGLFTK